MTDSAVDENVPSPGVSVHGVLVNVDGSGVLITGRSGIGKSACALELIDAGHQLVADDVVEIERVGNSLFGSAPLDLRGLMEIKGLGICDVRQLFGDDRLLERQRIDLSIELRAVGDGDQIERIGAKTQFRRLLGSDIPLVIFHISAWQNLRVLIETAVKYVKVDGSAEKDLIARHDQELMGVTARSPAQVKT